MRNSILCGQTIKLNFSCCGSLQPARTKLRVFRTRWPHPAERKTLTRHIVLLDFTKAPDLFPCGTAAVVAGSSVSVQLWKLVPEAKNNNNNSTRLPAGRSRVAAAAAAAAASKVVHRGFLFLGLSLKKTLGCLWFTHFSLPCAYTWDRLACLRGSWLRT